jgi:hypothetical protein
MMPYSRIPTLIAQAGVGFMLGTFVVIVARVLLDSDPYNVAYVAIAPSLLFYAPVIGIPSGLAIWTCSRIADRPLNRTLRCMIGVAVMAVPWGAYAVLVWIGSPAEQILLLPFVVVPGIGIGLVTDSGLRLWHELVRQGESLRSLPRFFAGLSGLVLRSLVVLFFMVCLIALIAILQSDYYQREDRIWSVLFFAHFASASALLFSRIKTSLLVPLALLVNVPMILAVFEYRYFVDTFWPVPIVYLTVWAVFLLSRWRQTDLALSFLNEEIHYYLID